MGITINFEGRLVGAAEYDRLVDTVTRYAAPRGWPVTEIPRLERKLLRVDAEGEDADYSGPSFGLEVLPSPECDPLRFEFDETLYVQEFCKTQFAGAPVHVEIVELLSDLRPLFIDLIVDDEGHYWDTRDPERLERLLVGVDAILKDMLGKDPHARGPIRRSDGRIVDLETVEPLERSGEVRPSLWRRLFKRA